MKKLFLALCFLFFLSSSQAQRIFYSDIEKDDYRQMNFEIIGKVGGYINIYKNYRNKNDLAVYFTDMKLKSKTRLDFLPDRVSNVEFVAYTDFYYMIYQYQKKNAMYCAMVKMNGEGKLMTDPVVLDTSHLATTNENKVYSLVNSDDKQKILIFKINRKNERNYMLTTLLYNNNMELLKKNEMPMAGSAREDLFTDFVVDNDGDIIFGKSTRSGNREYINNFDLVIKRQNEDTLQVRNFPLTDKSLDEVKIKVDNAKKHIIFSSFYYKQKKGNIDGLYSVVWDKNGEAVTATSTFPFHDTLRMDARTDNSSLKVAFNDYFIKHIIPTRDGGFAILSELYYTTSRSAGWSRYDYLYGFNSYMPYDNYYSPYNSMSYYRYSDPFNRYGSNMATRHFAENIMIFYFGKDGNLIWSNAVRKQQFDDNTDMFISYQIFNTGTEVRFLFNQLERRERMLTSVSATPGGDIKKDPTLRNLDKGYEFMPRFGKQVGQKEIILPCMYKNYICFAKVDFQN